MTVVRVAVGGRGGVWKPYEEAAGDSAAELSATSACPYDVAWEGSKDFKKSNLSSVDETPL